MSKTEALNSKTLVDLALLGFLSGDAKTSSVLIAGVKKAGGGQFTPTSDFIRDRLSGLLVRGHVAFREPDDELIATPDGRDQILRLLRLELDPTAVMLRTVCMTLKLCLLDLVDEQTRSEIVRALCCSRESCPAWSQDGTFMTCPLMARCLVIEEKRQTRENRFWQDMLLEEGLLDPVH